MENQFIIEEELEKQQEKMSDLDKITDLLKKYDISEKIANKIRLGIKGSEKIVKN